MQTNLFSTAFGWIGAAWSADGLAVLTLPYEDKKEAIIRLKLKLSKWKKKALQSNNESGLFNHYLASLERVLIDYFQGQPVVFNQPLDLSWCTPFQKSVLKAMRQIPYGATRSYGEIAVAAGYPGAARAVGTTAAANRIPIIIPCHRVIRQNGEIGGFNGSIDLKKRMLALEASNIIVNGQIP